TAERAVHEALAARARGATGRGHVPDGLHPGIQDANRGRPIHEAFAGRARCATIATAMQPVRDSVRRFDDRVGPYVRARPGYPAEVVAFLEQQGLPRGATLADIGSGTGKLSAVFLAAGHPVIGIEPNDEMRAAAQQQLGGESRFRQQPGRAEATGLPDASVDAIVAGQAFHWFEPEATRREWVRILRPGGLVALIWNDRRLDGCPLLADYDRLLSEHCPEYGEA